MIVGRKGVKDAKRGKKAVREGLYISRLNKGDMRQKMRFSKRTQL